MPIICENLHPLHRMYLYLYQFVPANLLFQTFCMKGEVDLQLIQKLLATFYMSEEVFTFSQHMTQILSHRANQALYCQTQTDAHTQNCLSPCNRPFSLNSSYLAFHPLQLCSQQLEFPLEGFNLEVPAGQKRVTFNETPDTK